MQDCISPFVLLQYTTMTLPNLEFPQISRLFSAPAFQTGISVVRRTLLWGTCVAIFSINIMSALNMTELPMRVFLPVLRSPLSASAHTQLAQQLWELGRPQRAKKELLLASELLGGGNLHILGASTDPARLLQTWESEPARINKLVSFWQGVVSDKPNYRDAYLILGVLTHKQGNATLAQTYWRQAYALDPTDTRIGEYLSSLKN